MTHVVRLTWVYLKFRWKEQTTHRASFILLAVCQFLSYAAEFALMWVMVTAFGSIGGWAGPEVMVLYGMNLAAYALSGFFFFGLFHDVTQDIHTGALDDAMVKPMHPMLFIACRIFQWGYVSHLTLGLICVIAGVAMLGLSLSVWQVLFLIVSLLAGGMIYGCLFLVSSGVCFFSTKVEYFTQLLFYGRDVAYYPLSIFPKLYQVLMTFFLPYAFINFFPAQVLLGKQDLMGLPGAALWLSPLIGVVALAIGVWFFNFGLRHYKSTGN